MLKIYVHGGLEIFRGTIFLTALQKEPGERDFLACGQGGSGEVLTSSEGGWDFLCITHDKNFPKRAQKHLFCQLCVSGQTINVEGGPRFNFTVTEGGPRNFGG